MDAVCTNSVFEEAWWLETVAPGQWKEVCIEKDNKIVCRWAFCHHSGRIFMPALTQTCSPWFLTEGEKQTYKYREYVNEMIDGILEKVSRYKSISIMLDPETPYFLPFLWQGFDVKPYVSYQIRGLNDLDHVFHNFSKNIRRDLRAAEKKLHITFEYSADILYPMIEKTFSEQRRKSPIAKDMVERILQNAREHHGGKMISAVDDEGNIHASAFFLYDQRRCYYLAGGKDTDYKNSNGLTLVIWEGIKFASTVSEVFDFEGSMIRGIENYFRRFGGEPVVHYQIKRQSLYRDFADMLKPHIKKRIGYKM